MTTPQGGMHNLTTLIKRLEAATSRLEDIASTSQPSDTIKSASTAVLTSGASAPSIATVGSPVTSPAAVNPVVAKSVHDVPSSVTDFDAIVQEDLQPFTGLSTKLGGLVADQAALFSTAFKAQRKVILVASKSKKPDMASPVYMDILKELQHGIEQVQNIREKNRKSPEENHLAVLSDGVGVLAWVTIDPKPDDYVGEILGGARMYGNRILTAYKEKEQIHVDWVTAFVKLCGSLKSYIKQHHPRGLTWNGNGASPEQALKEVNSAAADGATVSRGPPTPAAGGPPPPPPPPPPPLPQFDVNESPSTTRQPGGPSATDSMGAVFADLNRGESVTSGLRKVDKSQMTHKNPALRAQAPVAPSRSDSSSSRGKSPAPNKKPDSMRTKKPPVKELVGNKWRVENFENEMSPISIDAEKQHSILVTRCKSATLRVTGKANAISVDNCNRLDIIVDSLVSSVDFVNCGNIRIQVLGTLPSVSLDKVDGAIVFLSKDSLKAEIYTSKCSSINITLPPQTENDDSIECPVPEQFKSYVSDGKLISEIVKQEG